MIESFAVISTLILVEKREVNPEYAYFSSLSDLTIKPAQITELGENGADTPFSFLVNVTEVLVISPGEKS